MKAARGATFSTSVRVEQNGHAMRSLQRFGAPAMLVLVTACANNQPDAAKTAPLTDTQFTARINAFVDEWHQDAANARPAFFDKIASDGIYIGTDKTERWGREAFREWAKPAFARPVAWAFTPLHRYVRFSPERSFIWFDEQVRSSMGILQATGVMRPVAASFEIVHYQLSIAVPNEVIPQVTGTIKAFESK
jgi:hypothetical protein